jgi:hypothetical protein
LTQDEQSKHELRCVAETDVQEAANGAAGAQSELLGRAADQSARTAIAMMLERKIQPGGALTRYRRTMDSGILSKKA